MCCENVGSSAGRLLRVELREETDGNPRVISLDESVGLLTEGSRQCALTVQEAKILAALMCHAGKSVNTIELVEHVWGWGSKAALYQGLSRAKRRLASAGVDPFWDIRWGYGYAVMGRMNVVEPQYV